MFSESGLENKIQNKRILFNWCIFKLFYSDKNGDQLKLHLKQMMDVSRVSAYRNDRYVNALCGGFFFCFF